jgi:chromosome segregation ATPase
MRQVKVPDTPDLKRTVAALIGFVDLNKHLIAGAGELNKILEADALVQAAKVELTNLQAQINREQDRITAERKAADDAVAAALERTTAAQQKSAADIARIQQAHAARVAELEAQATAKIDDLAARQRRADEAATNAERRLAEVNTQLADAEQRRRQVRENLQTLQAQL